MEALKNAARLAASVSLFTLAACSGGGGAGTTPVLPSTPSIPSTPVPPAITIGTPGGASMGGNPATFAAGTTPNFATNPPAAGTSFSLNQSVMHTTTTSATDAALSGGGSLAIDAVLPSGVWLGHLKIPALSVDASGLSLMASSTDTANGHASINFTRLNYTLFGTWGFLPAGAHDFYTGMAVTGYQTPTSGMPTTGTATFIGVGGASGALTLPTPDNPVYGPVLIQGDANLSADFASGALSGSLSNMKVFDTKAWNTVHLSGSIAGGTFSGTTSVDAAAHGLGDYGLPGSATGKFNGAFYGPQAQEASGVWSVWDAESGGKAAFGVFGASKQ
jgi:hypothetical protein